VRRRARRARGRHKACSDSLPVRCTKKKQVREGGSSPRAEQGVLASPSNLQHLQQVQEIVRRRESDACQLLFGPKRAWDKAEEEECCWRDD